jgi:hypothetical protein
MTVHTDLESLGLRFPSDNTQLPLRCSGLKRAIGLTPSDLREIDSAASKIMAQVAHYPKQQERMTGG